MEHGEASRTALSAAGMRAAHQALEGGAIFTDPLALRILGEDAKAAIAAARKRPEQRGLRLFVAMRSRFAEDAANRAIAAGVRQILVLGAGLDTFAYRVDPSDGLRAFELDHPTTQRAKRARLAAAGLAEPAHVAYVAHDFEHGDLNQALVAAGLEFGRAAFVLWLGVAPYLSEDAILETLGALARLPSGVEVVFDYVNSPDKIADAGARAYHDALAGRVAALGEPFRSFLKTEALHACVAALGFAVVEDLDRAALVARYLPEVAAKPRPGAGARLIRIASPPEAQSGG